MKNDILSFIKLLISFLPFVLFAYFNSKCNVKKEVRHRQYLMPAFAVLYGGVLLIFFDKLADWFLDLFLGLADVFERIRLPGVGEFLRDLYTSWGIYLLLVLFNTAALLLYIIVKRLLTVILNRTKVSRNTFVGSVVELFYTYDETEERWFIKEHFGQARTFIKVAYYVSCFVSGLALLISCNLCMKNLVSAPFYPVFAVIIIGEMAFFIDGIESHEHKSNLEVQTDKSRHIALYPLLRKPLRTLFGDKLSAEGTTVNNGGMTGGAIEDILADFSENGGHVGNNYATFIRRKMETGLRPNVDYVRCGYDLAVGKSLLVNTPFYDKLNPYLFYAANRELLTGGKVLVVLGRHGTEEDLAQWFETGMKSVSNVPDMWKISVLSGETNNTDTWPDIGIISRSGVHDLDIHKNNLPFLREVSFVVVVEPSRLIATAQIGLNLLIKCCGNERALTFCSIDRNCDGLVDALSHVLMTNITEVSATEYPRGMSSYMYWTADHDYLQHRIVPGVSRCLGIGTELSMVALKNQVKKAVWYGGEAYPVLDARWIAKQYYYDLLDYAQLPTNQETFDKRFVASFNMCDERVSDYSFITVEDDRNNLFETRRNFATIAEQQGFINVISSEYMLREYMSANTEIFTADAKAIPYITADFARTKRNAILSLCLLLCIAPVLEETLLRQLMMLNVDARDPVSDVWNEICSIFGDEYITDKEGVPILSVRTRDGKTIRFEKDETILFKREYFMETGRFENVYVIENVDFSRLILDDLQNASYIAEQDSKDIYIGTELKGHVYQKYMPGQFFTLNGKYYEMVSTATDNRILVRRASEHIGGRLAYRQVRNYTIHRLEDAVTMGSLKTVNNIGIHYQLADFSAETTGYWKLHAYNDFDNGDLVQVNGVPTREYHHKQLLKFDFSAMGEAFTDSVRMTLTNLLNETFVTLFADNQPFISAVTPGKYDAPLTYSLAFDDDAAASDKCIYIIEDSQLDMGLLIAVERNVNRIFQIIADYLAWNDEQIAESMRVDEEPVEKEQPVSEESEEQTSEEGSEEEKKGFFGRFMKRLKGWFKKKSKQEETPEEEPNTDGTEQADEPEEQLTPRQKRRAERKAAREAKAAEKNDAQTEDAEVTEAPEAPASEGETTPAAPEDNLTPRQKKQAEKQAAREEKAAKRQEEKMRKRQEREAKKGAQAAVEPSQEMTPVVEVANAEGEVKEDE